MNQPRPGDMPRQRGSGQGLGGPPPIQREVDRVVRAITSRGRSPQTHSDQLRRLRREWPTLATALAQLLDQQRVPRPEEWK